MNLYEAQSEFESRYYHWALRRAHEQLLLGWPCLSRFPNHGALRFLDFMQEIDESDRPAALAAIVRRSHDLVAARSGEALEEDEHWVRRFRDALTRPSRRESSRLGGSSGARPKLRKFIDRLVPELERLHPGGSPEMLGAGVSRFRWPIGPWTVLTVLGVERVPYYRHDIWAAEHVPLAEGLSLLRAFGITSQSSMDRLLEGCEEDAAIAMANACALFLDGAPRLLDGLEHQEQQPAATNVAAANTFRPRLAKP